MFTLEPLDNPTYEEGINAATPVKKPHHEEDFQLQNPLYFNAGPHQQNTSYPQTNSTYEGVYSDCKAVNNETTYGNAHNTDQRDFPNADSELKGGIATAVPYEVPQTLVCANNDKCYSAFGPTNYATLEPHIPQTAQQPPPDNHQYSQIHH